MKSTFKTITSFFLFLNLYIILTFFWNQSEEVYNFGYNYLFLKNLSMFIISLALLLRYAQIIEVAFDIRKQNSYILPIVGISLPLVSVFIINNNSIIIIGYLLFSLIIFELFLLKPKGEKNNLWAKAFMIFVWFLLYFCNNGVLNTNLNINQHTPIIILFLLISLIIVSELISTCKNVLPDVSDRYDLYMLAYFSVAGVLFNRCSEYIANTKIKGISLTNLSLHDVLTNLNSSLPEILLFIFWLLVLVRVIQSLHLAALDYQDTQLKGIDLFILTIFYIFITSFWLLKHYLSFLYILLGGLSFITGMYFLLYMRLHRIKKEGKVHLEFEKRIQSVNSITFLLISFTNFFMYFFGFNTYLLLFQILLLLLNISHSYRLTMWVKFNLLFEDENTPIFLRTIQKDDVIKVSAILSYHFGYIYGYLFNILESKKRIRHLIYHLISASSMFGSFGRSHFFWIIKKQSKNQVGLICLRSKSNSLWYYSALSLLNFLAKYFYYFGLFTAIKNLKFFLKNYNYLDQLDLCKDANVIEISYVVINRNRRNNGFAHIVLSQLKTLNKKSIDVYPKKQQIFDYISLVARENNLNAISCFSKYGFEKYENNITHSDFDSKTNKGQAIVLNYAIKKLND